MIKLIDFWAPWCQPCKVMNPIIDELKEQYKDVTFEEVNVDENQELSSRFGVMSIPTFVILKDDKEVGRKVGVVAKSELVSLIQG